MPRLDAAVEPRPRPRGGPPRQLLNKTNKKRLLFLAAKGWIKSKSTYITTDNSVLDLIFSRDPDMVQNVLVNGNFHTSDHKLLSYNLNIAREPEDRTEVRYDYKRMNIEGAREELQLIKWKEVMNGCLLYTSPSPRDRTRSRMPSSA